ncbi:MAG: hypothetical protein KGO50_16235 [Myxococcales bacterium]|nr:hypothetical protein [Myxococcales bacterium]
MFKALPPGSLIELDPGRIVAMYRSINAPAIALGGGAPTQAWATVVGFALDSGLYRAYVWLGGHVDGSVAQRPGLLFVDESDGVRFDQFDVLVHGALEMVDEQGFHMERHEFRLLSPSEQAAILETLPMRPAGRAVRQPTPPGTLGSLPHHPEPFAHVAPAPPLQEYPFLPPINNQPVTGLGTGQFQTAVEISRQISLPSAQAVEVIARLLSLF